eukprot:gb/GECG01008668.1/.p1 GENE.gb/GECG01008668.1/~~gb/GECG01008668.1/.p1  ORF type:complete len:139 (+),score=19.09 gb/GECG01008668.1/:1-417(+)
MDYRAADAGAHKFLFCSEREKNYREYKKAMFRCIMAPWSVQEIEALAMLLPGEFIAAQLAERFKTWGGVPRSLVEPPNVGLDVILSKFNLQQVELFGGGVQHDHDATYKVLHLWPTGRNKRTATKCEATVGRHRSLPP